MDDIISVLNEEDSICLENVAEVLLRHYSSSIVEDVMDHLKLSEDFELSEKKERSVRLHFSFKCYCYTHTIHTHYTYVCT